MASSPRLDKRARALAATGADPLRVELLERARRFKRSWVEMAEALTQLRTRRSYEAWGFRDLHGYCAEELLLKASTVDKLTGSYRTLQRHAPDLLEAEADSHRPVPSYEAVDYFARALGEEGHPPTPRRPPELVEELHQAVFEQARPVSSVRREFNEVLFAKSDEEAVLHTLERTSAAVRRLQDVLPTIDGLRPERISKATGALEGLKDDLDALIPSARERVEQGKRRAG